MVTFVLVHGTTQSPAGWDRLAGALGTRGHDVTAIDLPVNRPEWTVAGRLPAHASTSAAHDYPLVHPAHPRSDTAA